MKRILMIIFSLAVASAVFADAASDAADNAKSALSAATSTINSGLEDFSKELQNTVPNLQTTQNVYADAFIGKLFPAVPPHFAFGANFGITTLKTEGLSDSVDAIQSVLQDLGGLDLDISVPNKLALPTITADVRVGGVLLPFDIGLTAMLTGTDAPKIDTGDYDSYHDLGGNLSAGGNGFSGSINFFTFGIDARYAILEDGLLLPGLSVGAGYAVSKGAVSVSGSDSKTDSGVKNSVDADIDVAYVTQTAYVQAQLSKKFFIITPFVGARMLLSWSDNAYSWNVNYTASAGNNSVPISIGGKDEISRGAYFIPQLYFGTGINLLFFQLSASAAYDIRDALLSGAFSLRFKL